MTFRFQRHESLPKLAWCARVRQGRSDVEVLVGPQVETRADAFIEGAWDGDYDSFSFHEAETLCGSGGRAEASSVSFYAPSHPLERLHVLPVDDAVLVSNSLAFILEQGGDGPDPTYPGYFFDFLAAARRGFLDPTFRIPTLQGRELQCVTDAALQVDQNLTIQTTRRSHGPAPETYADMFHKLRETVEKVCANAADPKREKHVYPTVAQLSTGYDSTAVATLVARYGGCRRAVTFAGSSDASGKLADDSGAATAALLGLQLAQVDRRAFFDLPPLIEAECFLGIASRGDTTNLTTEDELRGSLYTSGRNGERYWLNELQSGPGFEEAIDMNLAGWSGADFRLRAGVLHFPVPYVTAAHPDALSRITSSKEMDPWRKGGGEYERPIARRIAEEGGVPRESFGQRKFGGAGQALRGLRPETDRALRDYVASEVPHAIRRRLSFGSLRRRAPNHFRTYTVRKAIYPYALGRLVLSHAYLDHFHMLRGAAEQYFFHWGLTRTQERYRL